MIPLLVLLALVGGVAGCSARSLVTAAATAGPTLRIGLIADSQLQTRHTRVQVPLMSGKLEDGFVDVSLRPPALNELSEDLFDELLRNVAAKDPALILVLGDAANNGCSDELTRAFTVADDVRDQTTIPIYFVVGNHDYLGAGNTTNLNDRTQLCDRPRGWTGKSIRERALELDEKASEHHWRCAETGFEATEKHADRGSRIGLENLPVTKFELMREMSCFNRENEGLATPRGGWAYHDSFYGEEEQRAEDCLGKRRREEGGIEWQHVQKRCFLAATLVAPDPAGRLEILLTDTSDYKDKGPVNSALGVQYFGAGGWISSQEEGSQADWFAARRAEGLPALRIIASHYPPEHLGAVATRWFQPTGVVKRLNKKLGPPPPHGQYWVHGHEHRWHAARSLGGLDITAFGVGSTTDHSEADDELTPPHAAVVTYANGGMEPDIVLLQEECAPVEAALGGFRRIRAGRATYSPVLKRGYWQSLLALRERDYAPGEEADLLLGLDKSYRDDSWMVADETGALQNLATFIDEFARDRGRGRGVDCSIPKQRLENPICLQEASLARICLALRSSRLEKTNP